MLCGDQFQSKLQKLLSFMTIGQDILPNQKYADELEDNVLKSVLVQLENQYLLLNLILQIILWRIVVIRVWIGLQL